jgi:hypothetical protein
MANSTEKKTPILGKAAATSAQMYQYLQGIHPQAPDYSQLYLNIGEKYGVRGDLAFCQSIKETGAWRFGGSVQPEQNNFSGLGAVSSSEKGASFAAPVDGIEAQIQHLYGYATVRDLPEGTLIVDPRFEILELAGLRGTAPNWEDLNGKWAVPGSHYGQDIVRIWREVLKMPVNNENWKMEALQWLKDEQLIRNEHEPDSPVTWAELGTVLRRIQEKSSN